MVGSDGLAYLLLSYGPFILVVAAAFLAIEATFIAAARRRRERGEINSRLRVLARADNREAALVHLRRSRGLSSQGRYQVPLVAFNRLLLQSGISMPLERLLLIIAFAGVMVGVLAYALTATPVISMLSSVVAGAVLPVLLLTAMRARRQKRFEEQLPEAIDILVRSLRAGHPIPVAISLVASEMPDPIGSEFGMVSDEMTYGLDLESAMNNMRARAGQSDLAMLVVAISIQSKTGGNLAEILSNLARMVRSRSRMRRKIRALSSEGRFSAVALSIVPLVIYGVVNVLAPTYYSDVRDDPAFEPTVYLALMLWAAGVYVLRRMVNFKV